MDKRNVLKMSGALLISLSLFGCGTAGGTGGSSSAKASAPVASDGKVLVAYFTGSGNTKRAANTVAKAVNGDLYEITPETPYTADDLNYRNDNCRANKEMNDIAARPAIKGSVRNMNEYKTVFIGYPIWWGTAPRIVDTFVESYDFTGKTIVPFATSGGSGIGTSEDDLKTLVKGTPVFLPGKILSANESLQNVQLWINDIFKK